MVQGKEQKNQLDDWGDILENEPISPEAVAAWEAETQVHASVRLTPLEQLSADIGSVLTEEIPVTTLGESLQNAVSHLLTDPSYRSDLGHFHDGQIQLLDLVDATLSLSKIYGAEGTRRAQGRMEGVPGLEG